MSDVISYEYNEKGVMLAGNNAMWQLNDILTERYKEAIEVIEFYADDNQYDYEYDAQGNPLLKVQLDRGKKARDYLKKIKDNQRTQ